MLDDAGGCRRQEEEGVMWRRILGFSIALGAAGNAAGAIVPIGPFDGDKAEGFETQPPFQFERSYDVLGSQGVVQQFGAGQGLHITTSWLFFGVVFPHSGTYFMGGAGVNAEWVFDVPALRFGGYFTTNRSAGIPGPRARGRVPISLFAVPAVTVA